MATLVDIAGLVEIDPLYMGGAGWPVIRGTGVPVVQVAYARIDEAMTAEEIAEDRELTLPQVYAALAYYYANREELDRQVEEADAESERMASEWPSKLRT